MNSLWNTRVPHTLIQKALTRRDDRALRPTNPLVPPLSTSFPKMQTNKTPHLPQPTQRHGPLSAVATAHPVREHVHPVALTQQVQRRLGDADVRLDADDGDLVGDLGALGEGVAEFGDEHGEGGLVDCVEGGVVEFGADWGGAIVVSWWVLLGGGVKMKKEWGRLTWTEAGGGLCGCVDGDGEGVAGANHLLGGGYAAGSCQKS